LIGNGSNGRATLQGASDLMDAPVTTGSGALVGYVEEVLLNPATGKLEFLIVRPPLQEGGLFVRLDWKDVKLDLGGERLILIPGRTATKRLLMRACAPQEGDRRVH
jgi:sporulation protein YlmC with PRC-barrel domain